MLEFFMKSDIIGRESEKERLQAILNSHSPEFLAIYGRRRVGKTFLIRNFFEGEGLFFELTGQKGASLPVQLNNFHMAFMDLFVQKDKTSQPPSSWNAALSLLIKSIKKYSSRKKIIFFFDELPWLAGRKSGFIEALDFFWNTWGNKQPNITLIVCGSAASWMISKIIHQKGGLYNRITARMRLLPFTLPETEKYLKSQKINYSRKQIIEIYMAIGGIPHYLKQLRRGLSPAQNIDYTCFSKDGLLSDEFDIMFASLFDHADIYIAVVRLLARKRAGFTRQEILDNVQMKTGGGMSKVLAGLEESGFISKSTPYKKRRRDAIYRLIDEYSLFYINWVETAPSSIFLSPETLYWQQCHQSHNWNIWTEFSFEGICLKHSYQIKKALGISGISTIDTTWYAKDNEIGIDGVQIDLLIDRGDNCINLCEIKFSNGEYSITKKYADNLMNKVELFRSRTGTRKTIFLTLITTYGVKKNIYFEQCIDSHMTMDILFQSP